MATSSVENVHIMEDAPVQVPATNLSNIKNKQRRTEAYKEMRKEQRTVKLRVYEVVTGFKGQILTVGESLVGWPWPAWAWNGMGWHDSMSLR